MTRLSDKFDEIKSEGRTALISFTMAGDPDLSSSTKLLNKLPNHGVDIIELGMPFSDPTADGPAIQAAALRSLESKTKLSQVLDMVIEFRKINSDTPIILMGYYNPIRHYGGERFTKDAAKAGIDGLIIVDLPPEEEEELTPYLDLEGLAMIRLIAPTTGEERLEKLLKNAAGFIYTIAIKGITGASSADESAIKSRIEQIRKHTDLPIVAGFGIKTPEQATKLKNIADGVVVGSAIVDCFSQNGEDKTLELVKSLSDSLR